MSPEVWQGDGVAVTGVEVVVVEGRRRNVVVVLKDRVLVDGCDVVPPPVRGLLSLLHPGRGRRTALPGGAEAQHLDRLLDHSLAVDGRHGGYLWPKLGPGFAEHCRHHLKRAQGWKTVQR